MKTTMHLFYTFLFSCFVLIAFSSCNNDDNGNNQNQDNDLEVLQRITNAQYGMDDCNSRRTALYREADELEAMLEQDPDNESLQMELNEVNDRLGSLNCAVSHENVEIIPNLVIDIEPPVDPCYCVTPNPLVFKYFTVRNSVNQSVLSIVNENQQTVWSETFSSFNEAPLVGDQLKYVEFDWSELGLSGQNATIHVSNTLENGEVVSYYIAAEFQE